MKRIAFVILNYKTPELVVDCLRSLETELDKTKDIAIVVDNCSPDDSAEKIRHALETEAWGDWAELIVADGNDGFSAGNNVGMQAVEAEAYWLTNSDTIFRENSVETLWQAMVSHPRAGMVSPRLEWPDGTPQISCFRNISPLTEFIESAQTGPITKLFKNKTIPIEISELPSKPEWTSFASVLIRAETVRQVGWMDEGFFMYFEDVDYGRRVWTAGWEILNVPRSRVVHLRGGSSDVKSATKARKRRPKYFYQARSRYLAKYYGRLGLYLANDLWMDGRAIAFVREKIGSKEPHACEKEWLDIWTNWANPMK